MNILKTYKRGVFFLERILNDDEKIRRAEEIYYRRNNQNFPVSTKSKNKKSIKDRFLLNLLMMFNIAVIIFCIQNKDFIFTKEFLGTLEQYNSNASNKIINFFEYIMNDENEVNNQKDLNSVENIIQNNEESLNIYENVIIENTEREKLNQVVENNNETSSSINEMELDVKNLNAAYSFSLPLNGIVSSTFGARESKYQNVKGYHTGIDLAADKGTTIKAAMQGIVELVSSEGDYGKHLKIRCNNVTTLYAHCSKIYVKEGQIVAEGQEIAAVGSTGNSTGPHLHFEIRVDDRFVDPALVINF